MVKEMNYSFSVRKKNGSLHYMRDFSQGISNLSFLQGSHYLQLLQIVPVLICDSGDKLMPVFALKKFLSIFSTLQKIVFLIFKTSVWKENTFTKYDKLVDDFVSLLVSDSFRFLSASKMCFIKLHMLYHFPYFIKWFGSPMNFDSGKFSLFIKF